MPTKSKKQEEISLMDAGEIIDHDSLPDHVNQYFSSVGDKLASQLNQPWEFKGVECDTEINVCTTTLEDIRQFVKIIDIKKSSNIQDLSTKVIKIALITLSEQFMHIINNILLSSKIPDTWKRGTITPIPKGGDRTQVINLRPITI